MNTNGDTKIYNHAEKELDILLKTTPDNIIEEFRDEILAICSKFGNSGQGGSSAPFIAKVISDSIKKLYLQQTIAPLTGEDDEWVEYTDGKFQNMREGGVFKDGKMVEHTI